LGHKFPLFFENYFFLACVSASIDITINEKTKQIFLSLSLSLSLTDSYPTHTTMSTTTMRTLERDWKVEKFSMKKEKNPKCESVSVCEGTCEPSFSRAQPQIDKNTFSAVAEGSSSSSYICSE
jgi:hypothetical protein